jgi:hypothetical protein
MIPLPVDHACLLFSLLASMINMNLHNEAALDTLSQLYPGGNTGHYEAYLVRVFGAITDA